MQRKKKMHIDISNLFCLRELAVGPDVTSANAIFLEKSLAKMNLSLEGSQ